MTSNLGTGKYCIIKGVGYGCLRSGCSFNTSNLGLMRKHQRLHDYKFQQSCPECEGAGIVAQTDMQSLDDHKRCPACRGSGVKA